MLKSIINKSFPSFIGSERKVPDVKVEDFKKFHPIVILAASMYLEADFHGYKINGKGEVFSKMKNRKKMSPCKNYRNGGNFDLMLILHIDKKRKNLVIQRIMGHVFYGMVLYSPLQVNHLDRNTSNNNLWNLEITTPSENQKHWRNDDKLKSL